jgi:uncharacterized damage-inducible protein DinB
MLGLTAASPILDLLAAAESFDELGDRAPLAAVREAWDALNPILAEAITDLDAERPPAVPGRLPAADGTRMGTLVFLLQHEAYHLGQIGLLRRELGFPALRYSTAPRR